jgi:hypothetical protein
VWAQTPPLGAGAPTWRSSTGCDWRGARLRGLTGVAPSRSRCVGSSASPAVTPSPESGVALSQRCGLRDRGRGAHRGQHGGGRADVVSERAWSCVLGAGGEPCLWKEDPSAASHAVSYLS